MDREAWRAIAQGVPRVRRDSDKTTTTPLNFSNITCVREIIWKQNRGPKHSTEIIRAKCSRNILSKSIQSRRNWSYCDWFRLITFGFFPRIHLPIFEKNGSILDSQISIVRILETSNQRSPLATKNWISQWKACRFWGTAIDSKYEHLSWAEEKKVFQERPTFEIEVGKGYDSLLSTVIIIITPA